MAGQITFARAMQKKRNPLKGSIQKKKNTPKTMLLVTSKSGEDAGKVWETFTKTINPSKEKDKRVRSMRTAGKVLIVVTCSKEDARKITANKELEQELKWEPRKKEEEVLDCIYEQNLTEHCSI